MFKPHTKGNVPVSNLPLYEQATHWLETAIGNHAAFRDGQWEAIEALVVNRQRTFVVQRTGWGKSLVYFLATKLLRDQGYGPTILISPLLSLMRNQLEAADKLGLQATTINSTNQDDWQLIEQDIRANKIDLLLISPERLRNERFQETVWRPIAQEIGLFVVDEAHCISDWGHDFRPDYRRIMGLLDELADGTPVLGTTATANDRVVEDVAEILGDNLMILRGPLTRQSLELYAVREQLSQAERLVLLRKLLARMAGSGIIYCATTYDCQQVAEWLQLNGYNAKAYYANVEDDTGENRVDLEQQLLNNEVQALVASVALGMGFDKPDLHFVIHYQHPDSIISYYQQIGRAGRGIDSARIILLHGHEDRDVQEYFINTAFPHPEQVGQAIATLRDDGPQSRNELQRSINARGSTIDKILLHLELEGVVVKEGRQWELTGRQTEPDYERWGQVTAQRYRELAQMERFIQYEDCLMRFIAEALDDHTVDQNCGRCQNCRDTQIYSKPAPDEIERARQFLTQERFILLQPRKMWVPGGIGALKGKIADPNAIGLALAYANDGGWGRSVRLGKFEHQQFSPELVEASAELLTKYWQQIDEHPQWVTCVPSLRYPNLVPEFAQQLAQTLDLPFLPAIEKTDARPPQTQMQNSFQQLQNLWKAFSLEGDVLNEPVLLIDDFIDSGWTLTYIGAMLRHHGSGVVHPFVLAKTSR